jgi:hypothetical protein
VPCITSKKEKAPVVDQEKQAVLPKNEYSPRDTYGDKRSPDIRTNSKLKMKGKIIATPPSDYEIEMIDKQLEGKSQNVFGLNNNMTQKEQLDKMNRSATEALPK